VDVDGTLIVFSDTFKYVNPLIHALLRQNAAMNFRACDTFSTQTPNHCTLLIFGASSKRSGHVDDARCAGQLNGQGQIISMTTCKFLAYV
jgi:hypothetical protein